MTRLAALLSLSLAALAALAPGAAQASAEAPADLLALEQQMGQLQANSERFSFQEELSLNEGLLGRGIPFDLLVAGRGEASDAPPQASLEAGLFGVSAEPVRMIGETSYRYERSAAEADGGRPWVRSTRKPSPTGALDPGGILGGDQGGKQGTFSKLIEELGRALAIEESGPATVDDQRVLEFDATLDPTPILAQLEKSTSSPPKAPLNSLLRIPSVGGSRGSRKPVAPPSLKLELFIAPNGLPVRVRVTLAVEGVTVAVRVDTLAINVPVHVSPPPAAETIDEASLRRIEARHLARARRRLLRDCRRLRGKRVARCRAAVRHLHVSAPQPESPLP